MVRMLPPSSGPSARTCGLLLLVVAATVIDLAPAAAADPGGKCINSACTTDSDCVIQVGNRTQPCSKCTNTHTFAGMRCMEPDLVYRCAPGGVCTVAPKGQNGTSYATCQRVCLVDGFACQDSKCIPFAGGVNISSCHELCEPAHSAPPAAAVALPSAGATGVLWGSTVTTYPAPANEPASLAYQVQVLGTGGKSDVFVYTSYMYDAASPTKLWGQLKQWAALSIGWHPRRSPLSC